MLVECIVIQVANGTRFGLIACFQGKQFFSYIFSKSTIDRVATCEIQTRLSTGAARTAHCRRQSTIKGGARGEQLLRVCESTFVNIEERRKYKFKKKKKKKKTRKKKKKAIKIN